VALHQPSFLDDAVIFAHAYEQRNASRDAMVLQPATLIVAEGELVEALLQEFALLFWEPTGLPPPYNCSHQIHLLSSLWWCGCTVMPMLRR
jgi:hypothetical protein